MSCCSLWTFLVKITACKEQYHQWNAWCKHKHSISLAKPFLIERTELPEGISKVLCSGEQRDIVYVQQNLSIKVFKQNESVMQELVFASLSKVDTYRTEVWSNVIQIHYFFYSYICKKKKQCSNESNSRQNTTNQSHILYWLC